MGFTDIFKKKKAEDDVEIPDLPAAPQYPETYNEPAQVPPAQYMPAAERSQEPPSDVPVASVISMQDRGLTNNQIIQDLQRQGYSPQQIYDALAQAEAKSNIEPLQTPSDSFETVAEQIVEEKWSDFQRQISKLNEWKDSVDSRIDKFEQSITDLRSDLESLHKAIVSRVGEYDKTLMDVGTEIKAMEKVFQKVLPDLTSNVQELSRITAKVKDEK